MKNNYYLVLSSATFLIPVVIFLLKYCFINTAVAVARDSILLEAILVVCLTVNFILSVAFWYNPVKYSVIHIVDAFFARLSLLCFSIYILIIKQYSLINKFTVLMFMFKSIKYYLKGAQYSSQMWCCINHIYNHLCFHIYISFASLFAFI